MTDRAIDLAWFRTHVTEEILPRWLELAPHDNGFLQPHLDRQWRRRPETFATLVSQGRLLYDFAQGWALTGEEPYREAVERGSRFFLEHFRDRKHGGWYWSVDLTGAALDRRKNTYGLAFAIFGLSHAARCLGDGECLTAALETRRFLVERLGDTEGGYYQGASEDLSEYDEPDRRNQNPLMHLYEALLALERAGGGDEARDAVEEHGWFIGTRLLRADGLIPETYDSDWQPLPDDDGGWINVGHQFEWAYLLADAAREGHPAFLRRTGRRLLDAAVRIGWDESDGGVVTRARLDGSVADAERSHRGWWEQCEASRALLHYAYELGQTDLLPLLAANMAFFREHLVDPEYGGWYVEANPADPSKGTEWKIDYHLVGMCAEAIRVAPA